MEQASTSRKEVMQAIIGLWADRTDLPETDDHIRAVRDSSKRSARLAEAWLEPEASATGEA